MKSTKLISILLAVLILTVSLASCGIIPFPSDDDKDVKVTLEFYIDGKLTKTETVTAEELAKKEFYTPEEREGYRFIGWFIDAKCEIPYSFSETDVNETVKLYGKYLPVGGGTAGCEHFWILGYCRLCEAVCAHSWKNAVCTICDTPCEHKGTEIGNTCKVCGKVLKANKIKIIIGAPDEQEETDYDTVEFDTAMYVDEILAHCMTYWSYKFRNEIYDIWVDDELVTDGSTLISKDCTVLATLKKDVIRVNVTKIDRQGDRGEQTLYLPKEGITLEKLGLIVFPQSGGFDKLLQEVTIKIDGYDITDGRYHINKSCNISFTENQKEDPDMFTLTLVMAKTDESYKGQFSVYEAKENSLAKLITKITGFDFYDLLSRGYITVNGQQIYDDMPVLEQNTEVIFTELDEGQILVNFSAIGDLGDSERNHEKSIVIDTGSTYEEVVQKMLGLSWEEYEDKYFSTQTGNRIAIHRDTVLNKSISITAIIYRNHERADKVYLSVELQFDGIEKTRLELDYDTPISQALEMIGVDFEELLGQNDLFFSFNVRPLVSDVKIKYDSQILGWRTCNEHEWVQRQCVKCGAVCNYEYYESISCPVCSSYHPTVKEDTITVYTLLYLHGGTYYVDNGITLGEFLDNLRLTDIGRKMVEKGFVHLNFKPITDMSIILSSGDKITCDFSVCGHTDDVDEFCTICIDLCEHEWENRGCTLCGFQCFKEYESGDCPVCGSYHPAENPDDDNRNFIHFYTFDEHGQMIDSGERIDIKGGESFRRIFEGRFGDALYNMMEHGYFSVNGTLVTEENMDEIQLSNGIKVEYYHGEYCDHQWDENGTCMQCGRECNHTWANGSCTVCGKHCDHVWENNACIICGTGTAIPTTLTFTYYENICGVTKTLENQTIQNGATISDLMKQLGLSWELIERREIYINGIQIDSDHVLTHHSGLHFKVEFIRTQKECRHSFDKGICTYCHYVCPHRDDGSGSNICVICKMQIGSTPPVCTHTDWENSRCTKCQIWCTGSYNEGTLKHTFEGGVCTNCGCTYGGDDHYILVVWANVDPFYVLYSTTFADYCELANIQADYTEYRYYQSILPYLEHPDTERRELSPGTILGEFGNSTHIDREIISTNVGHTHEWHNSACVLCAQRCSHNFGADGKCLICKCTHGGNDHYITVTTDYWANEGISEFVSEKFVPYSTTLYDLLNMTWEAGYSYATQYYRFFIGGSEISGSTVLGSYGNNVEITTLAIAPVH